MNKYFLTSSILLLFNFYNNTEIEEVIKLQEPIREVGMPLYEALNSRKLQEILMIQPKYQYKYYLKLYKVVMELEKVYLDQFLQQKVGIHYYLIYFKKMVYFYIMQNSMN
jgi:hypothetical protein